MSRADTPIPLFPRYLTPAAAVAVAETEAAASIPYALTPQGEAVADFGHVSVPARDPEPRSVRDAWDAYLQSRREAEPEPEAGI